MQWIDVVRYVASIGLTVFFAVALIVEFRHPTTRRVTALGTAMLAAIIACASLLIVVQVLTDAADRRRRVNEERARAADRRRLADLQQQLTRAQALADAADRQRRINEERARAADESRLSDLQSGLQQQLTRVQLPLNSLHIYYILQANDDGNGQLHSYLARVRQPLSSIPLVPTAGDNRIADAGRAGSQYYILESSPLFPDAKLENDVLLFAHFVEFSIGISKPPVDPAQHPWITGSAASARVPDLQFPVSKRRESSAACPWCGCVYVKSDFTGLSIWGTVDIKQEDLASSGKMASIVDLVGAQLLVKLPPQYHPLSADSPQKGFVPVRPIRPTIEHFVLKAGSLGTMMPSFKVYAAHDGGYVEEFRFPATFDKLLEICLPIRVP